MQFKSAIFLAVVACAAVVTAEVPQEHSHQAIVTAMEALVPSGTASVRGNGALPDVIFGLLGDAAAGAKAPGGDAVCLQQDLADTAISLAKGDATKIATALKYRALERNTGSVGAESKPCTKAPISTILVGLTQHQDPASANAATTNKNVELTLAKKLASLGVDPTQALETATFAPGKIGDPTAKGNTCDDANDPKGCIFTQNLNKPAATADEIKAAVGTTGTAAAAASSGTAAATAASSTDAATTASTATGSSAAVTSLLADIASKLAQLQTAAA